ncbi:MAG: transposase [Desulfobacteraceae bacterium]
MDGGAPPDPEVTESKPRRNFTAQYKLRILSEADACSEPREIGMLLRREGIYSSCLTTWRLQRKKGLLQAMSPKRRGRGPKGENPLDWEVRRFEKENERLRKELKKASVLIEAQKKMAEILNTNEIL